MAVVNVSGTVHGEPVEITWTDGKLTGDTLFIVSVEHAAETGEDAWLTPAGPKYRKGTDDGWQFLATALSCVDDPIDATWAQGGLPPLPRIPEGAES